MEEEGFKIALAAFGVFGGLFGTGLGWWLNAHSARQARDEERRYVTAERRREEERSAATSLEKALADTEAEATELIKSGESAIALKQGAQSFGRALLLHTMRLTHEELSARLSSANTFFILARVTAPVESETYAYDLLDCLERVVGNARVSLSAFIRAEALPDADMPDSALITNLLREGEKLGSPFEVMRQWIDDHPPCEQVEAYLNARRDER